MSLTTETGRKSWNAFSVFFFSSSSSVTFSITWIKAEAGAEEGADTGAEEGADAG